MYLLNYIRTCVCLIIAFTFIVTPVSAIYDIEGIPFRTTAQGEVKGDVLTFGTYGITAPPLECAFSLPAKPVWARVYTGVWGGTERYTGWEELSVNNGVPVRRDLFGKDDRHPETLVSGCGVYWVAHDCTDQLRGGRNTVTLTTSRGQPESRIDGRVYGIFVVAVVEDAAKPVTRYWIAEGNENLHGEGWSGTNPTRHATCEVIFEKALPAERGAADLTVVLLATTKGQPDYVLFNGEDLGVPVTDLSIYPEGARDIGNEHIGDATGGAGIEARYVDVETFDVGRLLKETNQIIFERGRDLDGDGEISTTGSKPEGEDYIHPVSAILTVQRSGAAPDFTVDTPVVTGAYAGEEATIQATVRNYGTRPDGKIGVVFSVDGSVVKTIEIEPARSGVQQVETGVTLTEGRHTITVQVDAGGDSDPTDNKASVQLTVGTVPDLSVAIGAPGRGGLEAGAQAAPTQQAPAPLFALVAGLFVAAFLARRPPGGKTAVLLIAGVVIVAACPPAAAAGYLDYTIPITIKNGSGSDVGAFDLTIYLDGEKAAVKQIEGIGAGATVTIDLPLYTTPGKHRIKAVVDEVGAIKDSNRANNAAEGEYVFP